MKKRELSPIELKKVVELRQLGAKWTEIQQETKVERRAAKRAYEEWERDKKMREQEAARFRVAAEAFHEHLNDLIRLAEALINHLDTPRWLDDLGTSEQHLLNLFQTNILEADRQRQIRSTERLNLMIFKSLQDHTHEKVRWEALDEWKKAWDSCRSISNKLRPEAQEVVAAVLNEENDVLETIKKQTEEEHAAVKWMARTVLDAIWQTILDGKFNPKCPEVAISYNLVERQLPYTLISKEVPRFLLKEWNEGLTNACQNVAKILLRDQRALVKQLYDEVRTVRKAIDELVEMLNKHRLYPLILYTHCELCPI